MFDPDAADCLQLIEALADDNPIPDTSTICPDRQRLVALLVEISKGARSALIQTIRRVAEHRGCAVHEIASRATFLLACLDTSSADDPYTILGVTPTATQEQIKAAWLSLLSLYHPDRHPDNADWFTRQAARFNDAYDTLKDPARRQAFDDRRRRTVLARQQRDPRAVPAASPPMLPQFPRLSRPRAPALITLASVATAGLAMMALSSRSPAPTLHLETVPPPITAVALSSVPPTNGHPIDREPKRRPRTPVPQPAQPVGPLMDQPVPPRDQTVPTRLAAATDPSLLAQALPPIVPEPKRLNRREIDALLDEYVDAYEKGDVDRLMAILSKKIREKGTLDYQAIRKAYLKGFTGRDQIIYRLKNVQVAIKGEQATVTARYLIAARNVARPSKQTTVSGRIQWTIRREGNTLKIVSINY